MMWLLLSCATTPDPGSARLGFRFEEIPEGWVVTAVEEGSSAASAGLIPGSLITGLSGMAISEVDVSTATQTDPLQLEVHPPLTGDAQNLVVPLTRGPKPAGIGPVVVAFREAVQGRSITRAVAAGQALLEADFGGLTPARAVGRSLLKEADRPQLVKEVAAVFADVDDVHLRLRLGEALFEAGHHGPSLEMLQLAEANRRPDVALPGATLDVGGNGRGRRMMIASQVALGQKEPARSALERLVLTHDLPDLVATLQVQPKKREVVRLDLSPVAPFEVTLLDGTSWTLAEHTDDVVLVSFWATWCAPCKEELPEIAALKEQVPALEVLAVSLDDAGVRDEVERTAQKLPFAVTIDRALGKAMGVTSIPALRLIGRDNILRYRARGYSERSMSELERAVTAAIEDDVASGLLGEAWTTGTLEVDTLWELPRIRDVAVADDHLLGTQFGGPLLWIADEVDPISADDVDGLIASPDPLVLYEPGSHWLRQPGEEGWVRTFSEPVDHASVGELGVLVQTGEETHLVGPRGGVAEQTGMVVSSVVADVVTGRFGPEGALRTVVSRMDGRVIGLDPEGHPALGLVLSRTAQLAAWDRDGDGLDELILAVPETGVVSLRLSLP